MQFDESSDRFVFGDHDRNMLAVDWHNVPAVDAEIVIKECDNMLRHKEAWLEQTGGASVRAQQIAERDLAYGRMYRREILKLMAEHGKFPDMGSE